jgi:hypothetical protein
MISKNYVVIIIICLLLIFTIYIIASNNENENYVKPISINLGQYSNIPYKLIQDIPNVLINPYLLLSGFQKPLNTPSKSVVNFLETYGDYRIIGLQLCRSPLASIISNLFNYATTGKFNKQLKIRGMDDIFHLWLNITLTNGINTFTIKTEKTSIIEFSDKDLIAKDCFKIENIPEDNQLTLLTFFKNGMNIHPFDFYLYDGRNNNCQEYVRSLLKGSGYLSDEANNFLYQNAQEIFNGLGYRGELIGNFVRKLSNLAANVTRYIYD